MKDKLKNKFTGVVEPNDNKQGSLIVLIIGIVVIFMLFIYSRATYNNQVQDNKSNVIKEDKKEFKTLNELFDKYNDNYKYSVTIYDNNILSYTYINGKESYVTIEDGIFKVNEGTKKSINGEVNYKIDNNIVYNKDTNLEDSTILNGYLYEYFNPKKLYDFIVYLKANELIKNDLKTYSYKYINDNKQMDINITTTYDDLKNVNITYDNINYEIIFSVVE